MDREEFINELKNPWFWVYVIFLIVMTIIFTVSKHNITMNITSLFLLSIVQIVYGVFQIKAEYNKTFFQKYISLVYGVFLIVFSVINVAIKVNEIITALAILFSFFGLIMLVIIKILFSKLWNSKTLIGLIFFYLLFSFSLNYMFAFGYTIISASEDSLIINHNGNKINGALNYILFSYSNYYNSTQEYILQGYSKLFSLIQLTISYIFHIIILGCIIQRKLILS